MLTKRYQFKDMAVDEAGTVKAVFATLGVIDHDGDIVLPGAIENGAKVRISAYNHTSWSGALPVGKGTISEVGNELIFDGGFFLDMASGSETYKAVKNLGDLGEWSFGFDVAEKDYTTDAATGKEIRRLKKLKVYEVSPVLLGAGLGTRTAAIKSLGTEGLPYQEHAETLMEDVADFVKRSQSIADLRQEKGKEPASEKNRDGLKAIASELSKAAGELTRLATSGSEAEVKAMNAEAAALLAQIESNQAVRS
jgi:HK97 family phage prohead protease